VSLFNEAELREIIRDEIRATIRQELGKKPAAAGEFVSVADAARIASVSAQAIRVWVRAGRLTAYRAGRVLRVKRSELEEFLAVGPTRGTPADVSPEDLADRHFRERQAKRRQGHRASREASTVASGEALIPGQLHGTSQCNR
jgi:excisionase family DNA binding protein